MFRKVTSARPGGSGVQAPSGEKIQTTKIVPLGPITIHRRPQSRWGRLLARARARIEFHLGQIFAGRHPGGLLSRIVAAAHPIVRPLTPNDKWSLPAHVPGWMDALDAPPLQPLPGRKRMFMFCAYRGQFTLDFMMACLLAWRGHDITIGYLPKLQSPVKQPLNDHATAKPYLASVLGNVAKLSRNRIRCIDLSNEKLADGPVDEGFIQSRVKSDAVMYFRRETLDLNVPEVRQAWDYYEGQARNAQKLAWSYLKDNRDRYDLCLIANGTTFEAAQFCHVAKAIGMPVNTYEKFAFPKVQIVNHGGDFRNFDDLDAVWRRREELGYTAEPFFSFAGSHAYKLLEERRTASKASWTWTLQWAPDQSTEESILAAGIPPHTPFALVCPNVPFDAGYDGLLGLFSSLREWLYETVQHLLNNTSLHVVVRAHPAEAAHWGGQESSEQTLAPFRGHPRLTLISHDQPVNTYGLMETCKFGVVFSSTTGLEMAMMGKGVVVGASLYYGRKGFTIDSDSRDEYDATLTRLASAPGASTLTELQKGNARLFHFILHYVMQWPFPYGKPSDVQQTPLRKLLRSPIMQKYVPFIDALALTEPEWQERMPEFLSAGGNNHIPRARVDASSSTLKAALPANRGMPAQTEA